MKQDHKTTVLGYQDGVPVILAVPRLDYSKGWRFWCEYCHMWHLHGQGLGHRVAHCINPDSPFKNKGYILDVGETMLLELKRGGVYA